MNSNKYYRRIKFFYHKFLRQSGTPESIAGGVAIGLFIGLLVPIGLQTITVIPIAFMLKVRKIPAIVFTWITNVYTVIFIYPFQCCLGSYIVGAPMSLKDLSNTFKSFFDKCLSESPDDTWLTPFYALMDLGEGIIIPFFIGGTILGVICGVIGYFTTYGIILSHRQKKVARLRKRLVNTKIVEP